MQFDEKSIAIMPSKIHQSSMLLSQLQKNERRELLFLLAAKSDGRDLKIYVESGLVRGLEGWVVGGGGADISQNQNKFLAVSSWQMQLFCRRNMACGEYAGQKSSGQER